MDEREIKAIRDTMERYAKGEQIDHSVMRIVVAKALEIMDESNRELAEAEHELWLLAGGEGADKE
ncbi:hypothetical protein MHB43_10255 [Paenibacillus sp. FSL H8-0317]|uniref:hypothetical protein n=1 Tax=Paenibacillus sp. FSL H8-0317 TaxID=2921385 RepID=UPI00324D699E